MSNRSRTVRRRNRSSFASFSDRFPLRATSLTNYSGRSSHVTDGRGALSKPSISPLWTCYSTPSSSTNYRLLEGGTNSSRTYSPRRCSDRPAIWSVVGVSLHTASSVHSPLRPSRHWHESFTLRKGRRWSETSRIGPSVASACSRSCQPGVRLGFVPSSPYCLGCEGTSTQRGLSRSMNLKTML